jgi:hypothetical protein
MAVFACAGSFRCLIGCWDRRWVGGLVFVTCFAYDMGRVLGGGRSRAWFSTYEVIGAVYAFVACVALGFGPDVGVMAHLALC